MENTEPNPRLIYWEEFALSLQEFFQAYDRWLQDPNTPVVNRIRVLIGLDGWATRLPFVRLQTVQNLS